MKLFAIGRARRQTDAFEREFWSGSDLVGLYQRAAGGATPAVGLERDLRGGFKEFLEAQGAGPGHGPARRSSTARAAR
jgi:biopolymer transport protein TolQ